MAATEPQPGATAYSAPEPEKTGDNPIEPSADPAAGPFVSPLPNPPPAYTGVEQLECGCALSPEYHRHRPFSNPSRAAAGGKTPGTAPPPRPRNPQ